MNREIAWVDVWAFEHDADAAKAFKDRGDHRRAMVAGGRARARYRGAFLAGDDSPWMMGTRTRLTGRLAALGDFIPPADFS